MLDGRSERPRDRGSAERPRPGRHRVRPDGREQLEAGQGVHIPRRGQDQQEGGGGQGDAGTGKVEVHFFINQLKRILLDLYKKLLQK